MDHGITMPSEADTLFLGVRQEAETISDSASEPNSHRDSPNISDYHDTWSGRWGINLFYEPKT